MGSNRECFVCGDEQQVLRLLPCLHTTCLLCFDDLLAEAVLKSCELTCMLCHESFEKETVVVFHVDQTSSYSETRFCKTHPSRPLSFFCHTCTCFVCCDCAHNAAHSLSDVDIAAVEFRNEQDVLRSQLQRRSLEFKQELLEISKFESNLNKIVVSLTQDIVAAFEALRNEAKNRAQTRTAWSKIIRQKKQQRQLDAYLKTVGTETLTQQLLDRQNQLLSEAQTAIEAEIKALQSRRDSILTVQDSIVVACQESERAISLPTFDLLRLSPLVITRLRSLVNFDSAPIRPEQESIRFSLRIDPWATEVGNLGRVGRGRDLCIISLPVKIISAQANSSKSLIRFPTAIAATPEGHLAVANNWLHLIDIISTDGVHIKTLSVELLPQAVAVEPSGALWIASFNQRDVHRFEGTIQRFDLEMKLTHKIACNCPRALAIASNGDVIVSRARCIDAMQDNGFRRWSSRGDARGFHADGARGVAALGGEVLVCDFFFGRIVVLSADDGHFLREFGAGLLKGPYSIAQVHDNIVVVTERFGHTISLWNTNGTLIHRWGRRGSKPGRFHFPSGVCVLPNGRIACADEEGHRLQIF